MKIVAIKRTIVDSGVQRSSYKYDKLFESDGFQEVEDEDNSWGESER